MTSYRSSLLGFETFKVFTLHGSLAITSNSDYTTT